MTLILWMGIMVGVAAIVWSIRSIIVESNKLKKLSSPVQSEYSKMIERNLKRMSMLGEINNLTLEDCEIQMNAVIDRIKELDGIVTTSAKEEKSILSHKYCLLIEKCDKLKKEQSEIEKQQQMELFNKNIKSINALFVVKEWTLP